MCVLGIFGIGVAWVVAVPMDYPFGEMPKIGWRGQMISAILSQVGWFSPDMFLSIGDIEFGSFGIVCAGNF